MTLTTLPSQTSIPDSAPLLRLNPVPKSVDNRPTLSARTERPVVRGKFIYVGDEKLYLKGTTYGTFAPDQDGHQFPSPEQVNIDFAQMADAGLNSVRVYTPPPVWLLDIAERHGLRVMVGLPWEQHVTFLDDKERMRSIEERVREGVRGCAGHPAVLCYVIGNEIPTNIVRWYGPRRIEKFLHRLYKAAKSEDPGALVSYVNYPSTEYLRLPFLDFVSFNVYLESQEKLDAYLARLQNIAGDRPLVMAEIGLDSMRNGEEKQAEVLDWQVRIASAAGCAGVFTFAWTDEWYRGGAEILDWDFGLVRRDRTPKPALAAVSRAFSEAPFPREIDWPSVSVVVCSYNGSRTIRQTLEQLQLLDYPNYEVVVVDDGSTDSTAAIANEFPVKLISTKNHGLSSARNTGMRAARGEIVAYIDDDAYPDPQWLTYLASTLMNSTHVGVCGPNIAPPGDGPIADAVANSPGGPTHVLVSDREAEHMPGCNMAFYRHNLLAIGGFDPQFWVAGDDVDVCWKLQARGWTLGYSPAAVVWHHRRNSVRTYWRQQRGYGKAEALLERKWPEKYNDVGHITWSGRLYGKGITKTLDWKASRIYQGTWGSAPFQSIYQPGHSGIWSIPTMPEWYLIIAGLALISALGLSWSPLLLAVPLLVAAVSALVAQAVVSASHAHFTSNPASAWERARLYGLTAALHMAQPLARLIGRLRYGLAPWRSLGEGNLAAPVIREFSLWSEGWQSHIDRLEWLEYGLRRSGAVVRRGGDYDHWDLQVRGGLMGAARLSMTIEEHGGGKQLVRYRAWPRLQRLYGLTVIAALLGLSVLASLDGDWLPAFVLYTLGAALLARAVYECAWAMGIIMRGWNSVHRNDVIVSGNERQAAKPKQPRSIERREPARQGNAERGEAALRHHPVLDELGLAEAALPLDRSGGERGQKRVTRT